MTYFANFDPSSTSPHRVLGWFDTDEHEYGSNLPESVNLLDITAEQWKARGPNYAGWAVQNGALIAYTPPPCVVVPNPHIIPLAFLNRFTQEELVGVYTAAQSSPVMAIWIGKTQAAQYIDLADPLTKAGIDALVSAGLLVSARAAAILAI